MTAVAGWYPDPSGPGQLRYWDGQAWTSSTAAAEQPAPAPSYGSAPTTVAQPAYGQQPFYGQPTYTGQPGHTASPAQWNTAPSGSPRSRKKIYAIVAGVAVVAAVIATVVPLASGSGHSGPSKAQLTKVLLTADEVGGIADGDFTAGPVSDDDDDSNSKADCNDTVKPKPGSEKAEAERMFTGAGQFAEEDLSYTEGSGPLFTQLKAQLAACHTLTIDGNKLTLTPLKTAAVTGADDTLAVLASGTLPSSETLFAIDIVAARFGNNVVEVIYGAPGASNADVADVSNRLLQGAAAKAKSAF
jgi:hypothetical protein